jgi:SAM-dependent methyltransferase
MAQWSIGICTPVPMVPVDEGKILKNKVAEAAQFLEGGNTSACLESLRQSLVVPATQDKHLGLVTPEWQRARAGLVIPPGHAPIEIFADGMEVGVARCSAVECARQNNLKYLFFLDWDNPVPADALLKLTYFLDNNPDYDIASGMYVMKSIPTFILLWKDWNQGVFWDFTLGDTIKEGIVGIPMGCCLLRLSLFDKMANTPENPWFKTVDQPVFVGGKWGRMMMTEDLWFTKRYTDEVDKAHRKIMVDTSIWLEHICHTTGRRYTLGEDALPLRRAQAKAAGIVLDCDKEPPSAILAPLSGVVLHVGCGTAPLPQRFAACQELRLDIDERVKPDIVGSITDIPLVNGTCDLVYSSHNIEHLAEHEVPMALSEFYRVLKRGGRVEIECPDVQSVAEAIPKIGLEGTLYTAPCGPVRPKDVLFGLQSAVAAGNDFYAHKTAFTKESLEASLAKAQFRDVKVIRQAEAYALVAHATRP